MGWRGILGAALRIFAPVGVVRGLSTDPKPLWASQAHISYLDNGLLVHETVGHVHVCRWAWVAPLRAFGDLDIVRRTRIIHDQNGIIWYVVFRNETEEVWSVYNPPNIFDLDDDLVLLKELWMNPGPAPVVMDTLGTNALRYRVGTHFYANCAHSRPHFWWPTNLHLPSALEPFLRQRTSRRLYVINLGAAHLSPRDPLGSLFDIGGWVMDGLGFDMDKDGLHVSRRQAQKHPMRWIRAAVSPGNVMGLLHRYNASRRPVDIVKVDLDSSDLAVLEAILEHMWPALIVAEWLLQIPPPWEFAFLESRAPSAGASRYMGGVSLSALVRALLRRGYFLYKVSYVDAVFVHWSVADVFVNAEREKGVDLRFPIDEWACYLTVPGYTYAHGNQKVERPLGGFQGENVREWMLLPLDVAEERIRSNLSHVYGDDWDYVLRASEPNSAPRDAGVSVAL